MNNPKDDFVLVILAIVGLLSAIGIIYYCARGWLL